MYFSMKKKTLNFSGCVCGSLLGSVSKHEFQAETKKLLDIVARSLYSEKEVQYLLPAPRCWVSFVKSVFMLLGETAARMLAVSSR